MSDEYQLRKDIDRIINDIYDIRTGNLRLVPFADDSPLIDVSTHTDETGNPVDKGTLDAILEKYELLSLQQQIKDLTLRVEELERGDE